MAIEKKDKKSPAKENVAPTKKPTKKITVKKKVTDTARQSKQRKKVYDNFVDKNNNGINDRQEKLVEKTNRKEKQKKGDPGK
ncbi:MAG: hypothetical protein U9R56_05840 [candidate division Zixibacteria bacterium]|nr:hypothetical protein [candidate division Zixibacteria bacterium]